MAIAALAEAGRALGDPGTSALAKEVTAHPRFGEIGEFWWMSVAPTATVTLPSGPTTMLAPAPGWRLRPSGPRPIPL